MRLIRTTSPNTGESAGMTGLPVSVCPWSFHARAGCGFMLGACLLAMMALSGCSEIQPPAEVLVVAQQAEPRSLDPQATSALNDFRILVNLYEGLVAYRPGTLEPAPALAHSWKVSNGGRDYTFRLKSGVRFHDGTPLNAEAVVFNFRRMLNPSHPYHEPGPFPLKSMYDRVETVEAAGVLAVRVRLKEPFAPFLSNLAYPSALLVSPTAVERWGKDYGQHPVGTGPYRFVDWEPARRVLLERNDRYHGTPPRLMRLVFRPLADPMARVAELIAGGVDVALEVTPDALAAFRGRPGFQVLERTGPHLWYLMLNTGEPPFDDRRMRLAANLAVYKDALVRDVLQGTASVAAGPVPNAIGWAYNRRLQPFAYDPHQARTLIEEAGYDGGRPLRLLVPASGPGMLAPVAMVTAIQRDLAVVGIEVEIETLEWNAYLASINKGLAGRGHLAAMAWMANDPDTPLYQSLRCGMVAEQGGLNAGYYCNAEVDDLIEQARFTNNKLRRAALYRELARKVHSDAPWLEVASWRGNLVARNRVQGLTLEPSFLLDLSEVWKQR